MRKQNLKKSNAFDVYYTNLGVYEGGARFTLFVGLPLQPLHTCTTLYCTEWSADVYRNVQICANFCKCVQQQSVKLFSAVKYRLQGTFYWVKNGKNKPIKALKFK